MVSQQELRARVKEFLRFGKEEIFGLVFAAFVIAFVFSFRDWGDVVFDLSVGFGNFVSMLVVASVTLLVRILFQKIYGLSEGYFVQFKVWLVGLGIMLVLAFLTLGRFTLVLVGGITATFMVKQRLGEFRHGFSYGQQGMMGVFGVAATMVMAIVFAVGAYFFPSSYFFEQGVILNIIFTFTALLPLPQLDGLQIFFGSRNLYFFAWILAAINAALLLSNTAVGLIVAVVGATLLGMIIVLTTSEK